MYARRNQAGVIVFCRAGGSTVGETERIDNDDSGGRMADKDHGGTALPVAAVLGAVLSMQFGAAFATTLFDQAGAAGTVTVRLLFAALVVFFGPGVLPFLVLQGIFGFSLLEVVNYLEHYGLCRQRNAAGRYEKVDPRHSWNSDRTVTNVFLFQLQRHSDHHANPLRRYQTLRSFDFSPQLPAGYASMIVLALVTPLWRRVMDPRVVAHYEGDLTLANVSPRALPGLRRRFIRQAAGLTGELPRLLTGRPL